jgi:hypothetical protein
VGKPRMFGGTAGNAEKQARERARRLQCAACGRGMAYKVCGTAWGVLHVPLLGHEKGYLWEIAGSDVAVRSYRRPTLMLVFGRPAPLPYAADGMPGRRSRGGGVSGQPDPFRLAPRLRSKSGVRKNSTTSEVLDLFARGAFLPDAFSPPRAEFPGGECLWFFGEPRTVDFSRRRTWPRQRIFCRFAHGESMHGGEGQGRRQDVVLKILAFGGRCLVFSSSAGAGAANAVGGGCGIEPADFLNDLSPKGPHCVGSGRIEAPKRCS